MKIFDVALNILTQYANANGKPFKNRSLSKIQSEFNP